MSKPNENETSAVKIAPDEKVEAKAEAKTEAPAKPKKVKLASGLVRTDR